MNIQQELLATLKDYPDFPKPGIIFKDICPLLAQPALFKRVLRHLAEHAADCSATHIVGLESRGFLFAMPLAAELGLPFIPARKSGKLPGEVLKQSYTLEYGIDHVEIQKSALAAGARYLVVDDVIATGGTAGAVARLIQSNGGTIAGFSFVIELSFLPGRKALQEQAPTAGVYSLLTL
ncbi:MAG: adenine phosphoribosyltransferase [Betaproteobacteria bacterium]|nr:adenine phosphoribosyltransferase [Betaproteobacteria bacterium]